MWRGKTISVILPTYNEKDSIRECILKFYRTGVVDEIIVVNNNATIGTSCEIEGTGAMEVFEERQGYGAAIRRGFSEAKGDCLIVCEPDGTFIEEDIYKLLSYSIDHDIVFGSRTVKQFIWSGANMGLFLRWGNYAVAKMMELLFNTNSLSDVGCTFRLISRTALQKMQPYFRVSDNYFGPEMMLLAARLNISFVQIPVNYRSRVGRSAVTGNPIKAFLLGLQMIAMIFTHRMEGNLTPNRAENTFGYLCCTYAYYFLYVVLFGLCAFWISKPLADYLIGDASKFVLLVYSFLNITDTKLIDLSSGRDIWHPFLYQGLLIAIAKIWGIELYKLRLVGFICLIINLLLIRKICGLISNNQRDCRVLTFLTCLIFLLIPFTIEGALHIDIDNTIMTPLIILFYYLFLCQEKEINRRRRLCIISILFFAVMPLLLWAKLTTPLALPCSIFIFYIIKKKPLNATVFPLLMMVCGGTVFLITWYLFSSFNGFPFLCIFQRITTVFITMASDSFHNGLLRFFREVSMILFWCNVVLVILFAGCVFNLAHNIIRKKNVEDFLLFAVILSSIIGVTYLFIGGITYGIPKYHYPIIALASLVVAYHFRSYIDHRSKKEMFVVLLATFILSVGYYNVEDPLYLLTRVIKIQMLNEHSPVPIVAQLILIVGLYLLPVFIAIALFMKSRKEYIVMFIFVAILAQMIGFNFHQSCVNYKTSHGYGYYGTQEAYEKLRQVNHLLLTEGLIISPFDLLPSWVMEESRMSYSLIKDRIIKTKPDAIVYGPPLNSIVQLKEFYLTSDFHEFMQKDYVLERAGDYIIQRRR